MHTPPLTPPPTSKEEHHAYHPQHTSTPERPLPHNQKQHGAAPTNPTLPRLDLPQMQEHPRAATATAASTASASATATAAVPHGTPAGLPPTLVATSNLSPEKMQSLHRQLLNSPLRKARQSAAGHAGNENVNPQLEQAAMARVQAEASKIALQAILVARRQQEEAAALIISDERRQRQQLQNQVDQSQLENALLRSRNEQLGMRVEELEEVTK